MVIEMLAASNPYQNPLQTTREERGRQIASNDGQITRIDDHTYKVSSQSKEKSFYDVKDTEIGWSCSCPDHKHRGVKCKHIWAVQLSIGIRQQVKKNLILEPITITRCPTCQSTNIKRAGYRYNKKWEVTEVCVLGLWKMVQL